jgi:hypothetical protein
MRPDSIRLKRAHRFLVYAVTVVLFLSGIAWACFNWGIASGDFAATAKSVAMKIHGGAAMAILVLIGTLLNAHVRFAWRAGRNRINGSIILGAFAILIVTGYGLYYAGNERLRAGMSWTHLAVGLGLPILLLIHVLLGKRSRPKVQPRSRLHSTASASEHRVVNSSYHGP